MKSKGIYFNRDGEMTKKFRVEWLFTDNENGHDFCIVHSVGKQGETAQILIPIRSIVAELKRRGYINLKQ